MTQLHDTDGLIGTSWRIDDSGATFAVVDIEAQYAVVANARGTARRILRKALRSSTARTGYTRLNSGTAADDGGMGERP